MKLLKNVKNWKWRGKMENKKYLDYRREEVERAIEECKNKDFAEKLVLVVEIELMDLREAEPYILQEVKGLMENENN